MEADLTKQLVDILNQENDIYDTLSKISDNKTNLIVGGKVSELESIVKVEQSLVIKIAKLENEREKIVEKLCSLLNIDPNEITISNLAAKLGQNESAQLRECQQKMVSKISKLKNNNDLNSRLIRNSLEYIDFSINMMTSIDAVNNSYGSDGIAGDSKKRNLFDVKL
jgi:flagellar biosynthesis/type III secretory pathway chaperone